MREAVPQFITTRPPLPVACGGPNLRGSAVLARCPDGRVRRGEVITHIRNNRWMVTLRCNGARVVLPRDAFIVIHLEAARV